MKIINEHTFEIRYKPNPKILDYRGLFATEIIEFMSLTDWQISENRVDVFTKDQLARVFVSFKNAGVVLRNTPNFNFFPDKVNKFVKFVFSQEPFQKSPVVERIGVRSRFAMEVKTSFVEFFDKYTKDVFTINSEVINAFDAQLIDIGVPLNFSTEDGKINSINGPMPKEQLQRIFEFEESNSIPEVAFYFDVDYWSKPGKEMGVKEIQDIIKRYSQRNWSSFTNLNKIIVEA